MHKFFVQKQNFSDDRAFIEGDDVKHIYKVLRLEAGENVSINDCQGKEYLGKIEDVNKIKVTVKLLEELPVNNESPVNIFLYQGLPKSSKMDLIVQKATELGVKEITPVITERVVVKSELGEFKKVDRWNRIALEACKQCKRTLIPSINTPIEFEELMSKLQSMNLIVVPYENETGFGVKNLINEVKHEVKDIAIIIGPEGGFEEDEIEKLKASGAYIVTLGPRILRTETAGFVCASLLMYELGDMGGFGGGFS
ncbi:16S rRNA (uracil(1498)-N(3))-methyltransferase [Clostridium swellfunianum]|uniref:16S rRNA (uracil(1498)-N(3))-methyltransferase n=1 Tax=Clostridium swellfunianum TaxID=1367462 RepID=UPI00202ED283|nr:16S rRNA (uracil(1498)-N(3))-methyltransferase [Clostridium swellfunianum]MCM0648830.1 16S rRNA (uracil(1498)-N(3))-methyltransferase [Clostridium swellfunianum]